MMHRVVSLFVDKVLMTAMVALVLSPFVALALLPVLLAALLIRAILS